MTILKGILTRKTDLGFYVKFRKILRVWIKFKNQKQGDSAYFPSLGNRSCPVLTTYGVFRNVLDALAFTHPANIFYKFFAPHHKGAGQAVVNIK